jgi:hypothetical protein
VWAVTTACGGGRCCSVPLVSCVQELGLTRLDEGLLLAIVALACVLARLLWPRLRVALEAGSDAWCYSDTALQRRREARLGRISDVARQVSAGLDATLRQAQSLRDSSNDEANFWTAEARPFAGAAPKDATA